MYVGMATIPQVAYPLVLLFVNSDVTQRKKTNEYLDIYPQNQQITQ